MQQNAEEIYIELGNLAEYESELKGLYKRFCTQESDSIMDQIRQLEDKIDRIKNWFVHLPEDERLVITMRLIQQCAWSTIANILSQGRDRDVEHDPDSVILLFEKGIRRIIFFHGEDDE